MTDHEPRAASMLTRIRSVVNVVKVTVRFTRLLPLTVARVTHVVPFHPSTVKSVTP